MAVLLIMVTSCLGSVVRRAWVLGGRNQTITSLHDGRVDEFSLCVYILSCCHPIQTTDSFGRVQ